MGRPGIVSGCLFLLLATSACQQNAKKAENAPTATTPEAAAADTKPAKPTLDPNAVDALKTMSTFLSGLNRFDLTSNASLDAITKSNQRIQMDGVAHYKVKRPGIRLDLDSDIKTRRYFFDGKNFTIYSPKLGFYATMPAPATNREFLKALYDKFGISLPLADLFRWNDGDDSDLKELTSAFSAGTATLDGVETNHWAFRQGQYDWEVWIEQGARPLPRKLVIIDRGDRTYPTYTARLNWIVNPPLSDDLFTFTPGKDAKRIHLAEFRGVAK